MPILGDAPVVVARLSRATQRIAGSAHHCRREHSAWHRSILSPAGDEIGVLTLMTVHTGWGDIESEAIQLLFNYNVATLTAPAAGAMLKLHAPVTPELGDVSTAACVDFSVLARGCIA